MKTIVFNLAGPKLPKQNNKQKQNNTRTHARNRPPHTQTSREEARRYTVPLTGLVILCDVIQVMTQYNNVSAFFAKINGEI